MGKQAVIDKDKGEYVVKTKDRSKELGRHKSKEDAVKQLQAIEISKHSGDWGGQKSEDYHPGSNTGAGGGSGVPHKAPRQPSDLAMYDQRDRLDYHTISITERDFAEEHSGVENRGSGAGAESGGGAQGHDGAPGDIKFIYPTIKNKLVPTKVRPFERLIKPDFNIGLDTEYYMRPTGHLNLRREVKADSVCAWCQHSYDEETGETTGKLTPEEYAAVESHGICEGCKDKQLNKQALSLRKQAVTPVGDDEHMRQLLNDMATLKDPDQPADIIWNIAVANNTQPTLLMLAKKHPSLQGEIFNGNRAQIQGWLDTIDNSIVEQEGSSDLMELPPEDETEQFTDDIGRQFNVNKNTGEVTDPPEDPRKPTSEIPGIPELTPQESSMFHNHSFDEIWEFARGGDPIAQSLIDKGVVASRKSMHKQAVEDWTQISNDITQNRKIRQIFAGLRKSENTAEFGKLILSDSRLKRLYSALLPKIVEKPQKREIIPFANVLDMPRGVLDQVIWQDGPDEIPMLRPDIKLEIVNRFFEYIYRFGGYIRPELWVKNMFYTGSTATHTYSDRSDIDIHIVIDWQDMLTMNPDRKRADMENVWRELHDTFWYTLNKLKLKGTKHPIQYYVIKIGEEKKLVDQKEEIYDIGHDVWLIPPGKQDVGEDRLQMAVNDSSEVMKRLDEQISDVRKGLIDYALLTEVITPENAKDIYQHLAKKIIEIDDALKHLKDEYGNLKERRTDAFTDDTVNSNFSLDNIIFKFVERYKYLDVLRKVKRLTDDIDLNPDQVPDVAKIFGLQELFEEEIE